jgi:hypothetical protein
MVVTRCGLRIKVTGSHSQTANGTNQTSDLRGTEVTPVLANGGPVTALNSGSMAAVSVPTQLISPDVLAGVRQASSGISAPSPQKQTYACRNHSLVHLEATNSTDHQQQWPPGRHCTLT